MICRTTTKAEMSAWLDSMIKMNPKIITNPVMVRTIKVRILLLCVGSEGATAGTGSATSTFPFLVFLGDFGAVTCSASTGLRFVLRGERTVVLIPALWTDYWSYLWESHILHSLHSLSIRQLSLPITYLRDLLFTC